MKEVRLYNMILPPFMFFLFLPWWWIGSIVGNFIIDSVVLLTLAFIMLKKFDFKVYKNSIIKVWTLGFTADLLGIFYLIIVSIAANAEYYEGNNIWKQILSGIYLASNHSHFDSIYGVLFIVSGILLSAVLIFVFNYFISFKNSILSKKQKVIMSLSIAVLTAPYTFLLPKELFY